MNKKSVLESLLFVVGEEGLSINQIMEILELNEEDTKNLILEMDKEYSNLDRGFRIDVLGNNFKLVTKKSCNEYIKKLFDIEKEDVLNQSALETLAIIAYNFPITRSGIDEIRGVNSSYIVRKLLVKGLIEEKGRSDLPGRPILYGITDYFLDYFGLATIEDLPKVNFDIPEQLDEENLFESRYKEESATEN
ncbi:MAG: SMC-Scp complex subunit ScpB [Clostridium sp.]|nr:SMC-Scp complex subunit ScpB [Clostridium sp.]MCM1444207.1 SMC-Scp complex subunit ScpB [Candidatus Amulumruptor caecigallinarius]